MSYLTSAARIASRPGRAWTRADTHRLARLLGVVGALHVVRRGESLGVTGALTRWVDRVPLAAGGPYLVTVLLGAWAVAAWWHARRPADRTVVTSS